MTQNTREVKELDGLIIDLGIAISRQISKQNNPDVYKTAADHIRAKKDVDDSAQAIKDHIYHQLQKVQEELSQERTGFLDHIANLEKTHQEELQKARHDWLREEIVKLKGMKWETNHFPFATDEHIRKCTCANCKHNHVIQTIIDRYQAELDQEVSK